MRTIADRIRHAIAFELIALLLIVPLGVLLFGVSLQDFGVIAIVGSMMATIWVYLYNYLFDLALLRLNGHTRKSLLQRVLHAIVFEVSLLLLLLPVIAWYLQISLLDAFIMDAAMALFYMIHSFGFNWLYDRLFPIPSGPARPAASTSFSSREPVISYHPDSDRI